MKKVLIFIFIPLLLFVGLVYLSVSGGKKDSQTTSIESFQSLKEIDFRKYDSVRVAASTLYEGNGLKKVMQGENYREAWATPITVPVVFLDTLHGGMKIVKEGGGKQTHSLRLRAPNGTLYTLRGIEKDPDALIPDFARTLGIENIVADGISAQHPYGAVLAAHLAGKAGVLHTHPKIVFVPKQELLGEYNEKFGNRLFLLEYETEGKTNWTPLKEISEIVDTEDLQELKMELGPKIRIDRRALVRVRLFDLLIGDWDRHAKQWGWVIQKKDDGLLAIPVAGDRDNAFFKPEGVLPGIITNKNVQPLVRPFEKEIDYLPGLVYPFDVYFLRNTPEKNFIEEARALQQILCDKAIEEAFKAWPPAIAALDEEEISEKIRNRRDHLVEYATAFKRAIDEREVLTEPLKGSEDLRLKPGLLNCFECESKEAAIGDENQQHEG